MEKASPAHDHLPWFIPEEGQTDVLLIATGMFVISFVLIIGALMLWNTSPAGRARGSPRRRASYVTALLSISACVFSRSPCGHRLPLWVAIGCSASSLSSLGCCRWFSPGWSFSRTDNCVVLTFAEASARLFIDTNHWASTEQAHPVVMASYDRTHTLSLAVTIALTGLAVCILLFAMWCYGAPRCSDPKRPWCKSRVASR